MAKKGSGKVSKNLEDAVDKLVKEVTLDAEIDDPDEPGKKKRKYTLMNVLQVVDRKLKLEALKQKIDDSGYGAGFGGKGGTDNGDDD